ncbi:RNA 2'-phosphotransferase [Paracidovorax konjaci]|uniref:Probable RNA 2'-phosphotransferase n=1 Tax=Paracidovorax konjaci TaxID=32040 RepID=A0A1I1VG59_9BURK|nr:RNA 2'-phosphotransferase [Paracidovorax konjaci]SFD80063.1 putative RNA 2'-phosphotransferase [Paracidovorax konjaci]
MDASAEKTSRFLAFVLRHQPESIGLQLDREGWAPISALVARAQAAGHALDAAEVLRAAHAGTKRRYELSADGRDIRAIQGHSTAQVQRHLHPATPPEWLLHGTAQRFVASIQAQGLVPGPRHHVHLSADLATALQVGCRHGKPAVFKVHAQRMQAAGHAFYRAENGVWLTAAVPAGFLSLEAV